MRGMIGFLLAGLLALPVTAAEPQKKAAAAKPAAGDSEIEKNIRDRFARSKIAEDNFQVHVQGGVATLEGATDVVQRKGTATRLAKLGGAKSVRNNIQVSQKAKDAASKNLSEGRRRAQVKRGEDRSQ